MQSDCGIYQLTFSSGDTYVGGSVNLARRRREHMSRKERVWYQPDLSAAFRDFGVPKFEVLVLCRKSEKLFYERAIIRKFRPSINFTATERHSKSARETTARSWEGADERRARTRETFQLVTAELRASPDYINPMQLMTFEEKSALGKRAYATAVQNGTHLNIGKARRVEIRELSEMRVFESVTAAAKHYGINSGDISAVLKGRQKTASGRRFEYVNETKNEEVRQLRAAENIRREERNARTRSEASRRGARTRKLNGAVNAVRGWNHPASKPIIEIGTGIKFGSVGEAARHYGLNPLCVANVCKGKQKQTKGRVFSYLEGDKP
jgi:group I intron endonuclease